MTPTAPLWTSRRLRCRDGTGTYVRLTAAAFVGLECECAAAARPAAAGRLSGNKIEPRKCVIFTHRLRRNSPQLRRNYAVITQRLRSHYAKITQTLRNHYADIMQTLRNSITQHYAIQLRNSLRNSITQFHYAIPLRN